MRSPLVRALLTILVLSVLATGAYIVWNPAGERIPSHLASNGEAHTVQQNLAAMAPWPSAITNGRRVALVIGNSKYEHAPLLANPGNDARAVAAALKRLGFDVELGLDLTKARTDDYLRRFGDRLMGAQVGLFYYAGHGLQVDGVNYIAPVDARLVQERDLNYEVVRMDKVLMEMDTARRVNLVFLDACRDNPLVENLARSMRQGRSAAVGRGLAPMQAATGTLIAYATRDGSVALDGQGQQHSPYTQALLEVIETPGVEVGLMLRRVRERVMAATGEQQVPWEYGSLIGEFYFVPPVSGEAALPPQPPQPATLSAEALELAYWQSIQNSQSAADFEAYLHRFPQGAFTDLAKNRLSARSLLPRHPSQP